MPEVATKLTSYRFEEMAALINDRVDNPAESGVERYVGLEHLDADSLRIRRWGDITDVESTKLRFQPGDVIFGKRRVYQRKLAVADFEGICSAHAMVLRAKPEVVLPEFLPFFMQSDHFMERALEISVGSLSPTINWKTLAAEEFDLPPLEEQRRLAGVLAAADSATDKMASLVLAAQTCHRALARHVFHVGCDGRPPLRTNLHESWTLRPLSEITEFLDGKRVPLKSSDRAQRKGPYPYYGASGIIDHIDDYLFDEPLVLLSEDGANLVDRTTPIAFEATGRYWVNNHAHVLRVASPLSNQYVIEYIESLSLLDLISGTAQPKLNKRACEGLMVPVPNAEALPHVEAAISTSLDSVAAARARHSAAGDLRRRMLERAIRGGLV